MFPGNGERALLLITYLRKGIGRILVVLSTSSNFLLSFSLGCSSKTCNEAVRGDMGLDTLQSRRDRAKLKWWYKLAALPEDSALSSCLIRIGLLNHVAEGRGKCGVGWWMISLKV